MSAAIDAMADTLLHADAVSEVTKPAHLHQSRPGQHAWG